MDKYDLAVIGGGPAGYAAAMRAIDFGRKVVFIEKDRLGGNGIYNGALSSKAMWELSNKIKTVKEEIKGYHDSIDITFEEVRRIIDEAIFDRKFQLSSHLRIIHAETGRITYEKGIASFVSNKEIKIRAESGIEKVVYADYTIIASGSHPRTLPNIDVDEKVILTSDGIMHLDEFPKKLVIVGAGVIGCEFATMFANFGQTEVHIIDRTDRILPFEDEDVADVVTTNFESMGVVVHKKADLIRMEKVNGKVEYEIQNPDGTSQIYKVDKALLSVGRVPNIDELNIENAGIKLGERGIHIGDVDTRTNVPNIYAVGDVVGGLALVNVGEREARHAVVRMFSDEPVKPINYKNIATIKFLTPEVASVGINEQQAIKRNIPIRVAKVDYSTIARAIAMRKTNGFLKLMVSDDKDMKILGMRAVGEHASSLVESVALLMYMDKGVDELAHMIHPHPSIVEGLQECARMLLGKSIYKSSVFKDKLKCYKCVGGKRIPLQTLLRKTLSNTKEI